MGHKVTLLPSANSFTAAVLKGIDGVPAAVNPRAFESSSLQATVWEEGKTTRLVVRPTSLQDSRILLQDLRLLAERMSRETPGQQLDFKMDTGDPALDAELLDHFLGLNVARIQPAIPQPSSLYDESDPDPDFDPMEESDLEEQSSDEEEGKEEESDEEEDEADESDEMDEDLPAFDPVYQEFLASLREPGFVPRRTRMFSTNQPKKFNETFKPKGGKMGQRAADSGPVTIETETFRHPVHGDITRPTKVEGLVQIMPTTGRDSAPEPVSGFRVSTTAVKNPRFNERNEGRTDVQKGHIMALELGGPDVPENIVPQWAQWQSNGRWRQMERRVLDFAKEKTKSKKRVRYSAEVLYRDNLDQTNATTTQLTFPIGFVTRLQVLDAMGKEEPGLFIAFQEEQAQDATDDKLFGRVEDGETKKRKTKDKSDK